MQTFLGDFQKEQEKFVQEKKSKKSGNILWEDHVLKNYIINDLLLFC